MGAQYKNDNELLYMYHQGDEEGLELLTKKYSRIMMAYARRYKFSVKTSCDIQDIYQVSLIALFHAATTYKENMGCRFGSYFKVVMERAVSNHIRHIYTDMSKANKEAISIDQLVNEHEGIYIIDTIVDSDKYRDPKHVVHMNYIFQEIDRVVATFKEEEQEIYFLWASGFTYKEIADLMNLSEKKVDNILHSLKKKLRTLVDY